MLPVAIPQWRGVEQLNTNVDEEGACVCGLYYLQVIPKERMHMHLHYMQ
jgi:hypothetical protein